jgi:CHAT domain-containing protein
VRETGLGKLTEGEGVLGLQRGFQIGGARSAVASLWKVPDEQTNKLMVRFYGNLWDKSKPMSKLEALREAQVYLLREGARPGLGRAAPYYWAAFVLSGDWR